MSVAPSPDRPLDQGNLETTAAGQANHYTPIIRTMSRMFLAMFQHASITSRITSKRFNRDILNTIKSHWSTGGTVDIPLEFRMNRANSGYITNDGSPKHAAIIRSVRFTVDKSANLLFDVPAVKAMFEKLQLNSSLMRQEVVPEITRRLSEAVDRTALTEVKHCQTVIDGGGALSEENIDVFTVARQALQELEAPGMDYMSQRMGSNKGWFGIIHPEADRSLVRYMAERGNASNDTRRDVMNAWLNEIVGFERIQTPNVGRHSTGTRTNGMVMGAAPAKGARTTVNSRQITVDGVGAGATVKAGEHFTIAGVYAVSGEWKETLSRLFTFEVAEDATATDPGGVITLKLRQDINDGDLMEHNRQVGFDKNVSAYPADNGAVTFLGDASKELNQIIISHPHATEYCPIMIPRAETAAYSRMFPDPETGQSITVTGDYGQGEHVDNWKYMMAWGIGSIDPRYGVKILLDAA